MTASSVPVADETHQRWWRGRLLVICAFLFALAFHQSPGLIVADTKADLATNPAGLMARALHLWDGSSFSGQLANQAYGYLWPMGPFFWLGHTVGLPPWVVQRLWWGVLMCAGFLGMVKLAGLLGIGTKPTRVLGALAFVFAPRLVSTVGMISIESWPTMLAPWVLIPLVVGSVRGSPRRWAALSGLAFVTIGGVNAVATAAVLPLGALWLLTRSRTRRTAVLAGWWLLAVALASAWWALPLALLGRYSPAFLDWIESARITTSITTPANVLRGVDAWLPFLADARGPNLPAGWYLVATTAGIIATGVIAAVGAAGLALRRTPERTYLVTIALLGFAAVSFGHVGALTGLGADAAHQLLDGPLAPLRNLHKFDVLLRLPLALGVTAALAGTAAWIGQRRPEWPAVTRRLASPVVAATACLALIAMAAWPLVAGQGANGRTYGEIPGFWKETSAWLADQHARALVVPASTFAQFAWGRTNDEPLQVLDEAAWGVRDAVPLSSAGNIRLLDAIEAQLGAGRGSDNLAGVLRRSGFTHVVVRNDIDLAATGAQQAAITRAALEASPGVARIARFGPALAAPANNLVVDDGLDGSFTQVEVYAVEGAIAADRATLRDARDPLRVLGGPEALTALPDTATTIVLEGDPGADSLPPGTVVATDSLRKSEVFYGRVRDNRGRTLATAEDFELTQPAPDYLEPQWQQSTVAQYDLGATFAASSSGSDANASANVSSSHQPAAAVDGTQDTSWMTGSYQPGVGQWWQLDLPQPMDLPTALYVRFATPSGGARPTGVRVTTDMGTTATEFEATDEAVPISVSAGPTAHLRIELTSVADDAPDLGFGLAEVALPSGPIGRTLVTPTSPQAKGWALAAAPGDRSACVSIEEQLMCSALLPAAGAESSGLDRLIQVPVDSILHVTARAVVRDSAAGAAAIAPSNELQATASSVYSQALGATAGHAVDGDLGTAWIADVADDKPTLTLTWPEPVTIGALQFGSEPGLNAAEPLEVTVATPTETVDALVNDEGRADMPPLTTDTMRLTFSRTYPVQGLDRDTGTKSPLPVGFGEVTVLGADGVTPALAGRYLPGGDVSVACGTAPRLIIDGHAITETSASGARRPAESGQPLTLSPCDAAGNAVPGPWEVSLNAGLHRVQLAGTDAMRPTSLALLPPVAASATTEASPARPREWASTRRVVDVPTADQPRTVEFGENYNPGWRATLDGQTLQPVRVDGWRQAWVIPAGASGTVVADYGPDGLYRAGLLAGLVAALAVVAMAVVPGAGGLGPARGATWPTWLVPACAAVVALLAGGPLALAVTAIAIFAAGRLLRGWQLALGGTFVAMAVQVAVPWPGAADAPWWVSALQSAAVFVVLGSWAPWSPGGTTLRRAFRRQSN